MRERGSALLTAVVAVMVLLLISGIFFSFVKNQFKQETSEEKALIAYYLAEAGANFGIATIIDMKNNNPDQFDEVINNLVPIPDPSPDANPFGSRGTFDCSISLGNSLVYPDPDDPTDPTKNINVIEIISNGTGYYPNESGVKRDVRKVYIIQK